MKKRITVLIIVVAVAAGTAWQVSSSHMAEEERGLLARAQVAPADARAKAIAALPGGTLIESEIEEEDGRLIYCFEFKVGDLIKEVEIDAITGAVIGIEVDDDDGADDEEDDDSGGDRS